RIAAGVVAVACAVMARALKRVSVARGLDPRRMTLLPFGGAGALFGCQLADALGMGTIVVPPHPGALSALGLASAPERADVLASFHRSVDGLEPRALAQAFAPLVAEGARQIPGGAREAGHGVGVGARPARPRRHASGSGDPGRRRRDRARGTRLVWHRAPLGRGVAGAYMSLDAVGLEVMGHAFASIAEEMGLVLIHSAVSPNIRERRDCSAALFDAAGAMIAQAAHIPVHLGALHESVAAVRVLAP